jgi:o-succinylbenzoate synthase
VMVVKPAIAGYPQDLKAFLQSHRQVDTVFSSVFETEVGRSAALKLAQDCGTQRAVGFGVEQYVLEADCVANCVLAANA